MASALVVTFHGLKNYDLEPTLSVDGAAGDYTISTAVYKNYINLFKSVACCTLREFTKKRSGEWNVITFDDGLISDYEFALPLLLKNNLKATFFITAQNIGKEGYISIEQIREMIDSGMEIGSHGLTHSYLVDKKTKQVKNEIKESKDRIEQLSGQPVYSFAPVGGHYSRWMIRFAESIGYENFASMIPGLTHHVDSLCVCRRNHIQARHDVAYVTHLIARDRPMLFLNTLRYQMLLLAKRILGMQNYDRLKYGILRNEKKL